MLLLLFVWINLGQVWNLVISGKKQGHQAKSEENLVNTQNVTFWSIVINIAQNVSLIF